MESVIRPAPDLLIEGQRRHLVPSLEQVTAALPEIESLIDGLAAPDPGPVVRRHGDLPEGFGLAVRPHLAGARGAE